MSRRGIVLVGVVAFMIGALSPSFIDWQQADESQRRQILWYYGIILGAGLLL
jgi:hypothetical protein